MPLRKARPPRRASLSPQPEAVDRLEPVLTALVVDRMITQNDQRGIHQLAQHLRSVSRRQAVADRTSRSFARIETDRPELAADPHHQMAGTAARVKLDRLRTELFVDRLQQLAGLFPLQMLGFPFHCHGRCQFLDIAIRVQALGTAAQRHHAAPVHDILLTHRHAQTGGFQRPGARIELARVISQHRRLDHPAGHERSVGGHHRNAHFPVARDGIHVGCGRRFERRFSSQFLPRPASQTVTVQNDVFHSSRPCTCPWMLKKTPGFVLASLKASTHGKKYASASRSLRPRWMVFLNILK